VHSMLKISAKSPIFQHRYPPAACCRLKGRSSDWPLLFLGAKDAYLRVCRWLQPVLWSCKRHTLQVAQSRRAYPSNNSGWTLHRSISPLEFRGRTILALQPVNKSISMHFEPYLTLKFILEASSPKRCGGVLPISLSPEYG